MASASIAYAVGREQQPAAAVEATGASQVAGAPTAEAAAAAKDAVCGAIEAGERGNPGQGGVVVEGNLNIPIILRQLNTVVAVQNSLSTAVPTDVAAAVKRYVATAIDLTTGALAHQPVYQLDKLTGANNDALYQVLDACGVAH